MNKDLLASVRAFKKSSKTREVQQLEVDLNQVLPSGQSQKNKRLKQNSFSSFWSLTSISKFILQSESSIASSALP